MNGTGPIDGHVIVDHTSAELFEHLARVLDVDCKRGPTRNEAGELLPGARTRVRLIFEPWFGITVVALHEEAQHDLVRRSLADRVQFYTSFFLSTDRESLEAVWRLGGDRGLRGVIRQYLAEQRHVSGLTAFERLTGRRPT